MRKVRMLRTPRLRRVALFLAAAACVAAPFAQPADARCVRCDESIISEPEVITVAYALPSGSRLTIKRIVILSDTGAYAARPPRTAEPTDADRIDTRGAVGDLYGAERIFPLRLTAYVERSRRVGSVYARGNDIYVDLRGAPTAEAATVKTGAIALLTRTPFRRRLVGLRFSLSFGSITPPGAAAGDIGHYVGDAYATPSGLMLAPLVSTLPPR
ncbi:MAG: hypothetical protein MRY74_14170 [Neomegalonema sp.]|nr:hypothetical protein [Neomegalonema sp.]